MRAADPLRDYRTRRLAAIMEFNGARVLDVGFGQGADLVRYSQLGADAHGVDLDGDSVRFAREHLGVDAHQGDIATYAPTSPFDLVSLHDLIEHPLEPVDLLEKCAQHVRPGGFLSIWTPYGGNVNRDPNGSRFVSTLSTCNTEHGHDSPIVGTPWQGRHPLGNDRPPGP